VLDTISLVIADCFVASQRGTLPALHIADIPTIDLALYLPYKPIHSLLLPQLYVCL
jgi:hypothetical protein